MGSEVDPLDSVSCGTVLEYVEQGGVERLVFVRDIQDQVEQNGPRTATPSCPILECVSPETQKLWSARGDLEPVTANK